MGKLAELVGELEKTSTIELSRGKKLTMNVPGLEDIKNVMRRMGTLPDAKSGKKVDVDIGLDNVVMMCVIVLKDMCPMMQNESEAAIKQDVITNLKQSDRLKIIQWWNQEANGMSASETEAMLGNLKE